MRLAGHGKKVLSLALAAAMTVSLGTTAWADDVVDTKVETQQEESSVSSEEEKLTTESTASESEE